MCIALPASQKDVPHRYCRFYMGRRIDDDERQIGRWKGVAGRFFDLIFEFCHQALHIVSLEHVANQLLV